MRADRVRRWLLEEGIESSKILGTIGYGSRLPKVLEPDPALVSPESLERIRAQNRRITTLVRIPCS
jgi:outer membrane protein OmpA-like peptidoglycan-associated protein